MTVEVMKELLEDGVIENAGLLQILNEGRILNYEQLLEMQQLRFDVDKARVSGKKPEPIPVISALSQQNVIIPH